MKKIALFSLLALGLLSFSFDAATPVSTSINAPTATCKYGQCKGTAKSTGNRCKHCVSNAGDSYCYQHK